jgi:hypothetical protein
MPAPGAFFWLGVAVPLSPRWPQFEQWWSFIACRQ